MSLSLSLTYSRIPIIIIIFIPSLSPLNHPHGPLLPTQQAYVPTNMNVTCGNLSKNYHDVVCVPGPDAFNPCEDIMGNLALRVAVWLVVVTAVVGNLAVMIVLISSKFK